MSRCFFILSLGAKFVLVSIFGVMGVLAVITLFSEDPRLRAIIGVPGAESLSHAKYAFIGGAARFLDSFDSGKEHDKHNGADTAWSPSRQSNKRGFSPSDDFGFIESEQEASQIMRAPL